MKLHGDEFTKIRLDIPRICWQEMFNTLQQLLAPPTRSECLFSAFPRDAFISVVARSHWVPATNLTVGGGVLQLRWFWLNHVWIILTLSWSHLGARLAFYGSWSLTMLDDGYDGVCWYWLRMLDTVTLVWLRIVNYCTHPGWWFNWHSLYSPLYWQMVVWQAYFS